MRAELTRVDVLRLLRSRLDSIIVGIDDCIAGGGHTRHPSLLGAGSVHIDGVNSHGAVVIQCQDSEGVVDADFTINVIIARERDDYLERGGHSADDIIDEARRRGLAG